MFQKSFLMVSVLLSASASFAQTGKSYIKPKPTPADTRPFLQIAKENANAEMKRLEKAIAEAATNPKLLPCDFYALEIQHEYNRWFLQPSHYQQFEEMNNRIDATIATINEKLKTLQNAEVNVLVVEGRGVDAKSSEIPVAFKDLVDFFRLYDQRMKSCPKDQQKAMIEMMETRPLANPLKIVLSQVRSAGGIMSVNLNASLQETNANYELVITPKDCGFNLEIKVETELNGNKETYRISLLDASAENQITLTEASKWEMLSKHTIDGMPVDGLLRYQQTQKQLKGECTTLAPIPARRIGTPYVKHSDLALIKSDMEKKGYQSPGIEFVTIEPGTFIMGSPETESYRSNNETQHSVTLTKAFEMQTTEITQAQWYEVMKANPSSHRAKDYCPTTWSDQLDQTSGMCPHNPVENISWDDVQKFIQKLNKRNDGYVYRLPTEAEWEYAARGKTTTLYSSGNDEMGLYEVAWKNGNSGSHSHEVASAGGLLNDSANAYGLYDMHGNVWEWVEDLFGYFDPTAVTDPLVTSSTYSSRVFRGGSYDTNYYTLRCAQRNYTYSYERHYTIGARLVRTRK